MRIISQNGEYDIPYESVVIQRFTNHIYFLNENLTGVENVNDDISIAEYSSTEKAVKAMEALREAYYNNKHEETYKDGVYDYSPNFRFPKDDEIEV